MNMCAVRVGGDLKPLDVVSGGRRLLSAYMTYLLSPDPMPDTFSHIQRTTQDMWRRRYPPTSHSNWRQAREGQRIPSLPLMEDPESRRRFREVPDGSRSKSQTYDIPTTLTGVWTRGIPLSQPVMSENTVAVSRSIDYQIGSIEQFHECSHTWNYPIERQHPVSGFIRSDDSVEWEGYVPVTHPEDIKYSTGYFSGRRLTMGTVLWVPTVDVPTVADYPTSSEVGKARYNALLSMYGGTPPTNPNLLRALCELKDTSKTICGIVHFYKWARHMASGAPFWRRAGNSWRRMTRREVLATSTQEMAGAYLNGVFGIAPTLSDAKVFLHRLFAGLDILSVPQGRPAVPGSVITSRYQVRHKVALTSSQTSVRSKQRLNVRYIRSLNTMECTGAFGHCDPGDWLRRNPDILTDVIHGCVFARLKEDLSQYFLDNFGKVGLTWSYPPILTAYELIPWTWLIDWFSNTRDAVRLAERAARTFWMRVGFNTPWLAERRDRIRYCRSVFEDRIIDSDDKVFWPSYNQRCLDAYCTSAFSLVPSGRFTIGGNFWRGPYTEAPVYQSDATGITVRAFQISVGMALVLSTR